MTAIAASIKAAWGAKYGSGGTASNSSVATWTNTTGVIAITMNDLGSGGYDKTVSLSVAAGTVTATNAANISWEIGATEATSDNKTVDASIVLTMTSKDAGTTLNKVGTVSPHYATVTAANLIELSSTKTTNIADTTAPYLEALETGRADVVNAEGGTAIVAESTPAASYSRLGWL